jgi:hypothetical protein
MILLLAVLFCFPSPPHHTQLRWASLTDPSAARSAKLQLSRAISHRRNVSTATTSYAFAAHIAYQRIIKLPSQVPQTLYPVPDSQPLSVSPGPPPRKSILTSRWCSRWEIEALGKGGRGRVITASKERSAGCRLVVRRCDHEPVTCGARRRRSEHLDALAVPITMHIVITMHCVGTLAAPPSIAVSTRNRLAFQAR